MNSSEKTIKKDKPKKLSLSIVKELAKNSWRISSMIWKEKKWVVLALVFILIFISAAPFAQSGSRGLLINELINIAGSGNFSYYLALIIIALILATIIPAAFQHLQNYFSITFWFYLNEKFEIMILKKKGEMDIASHEDPEQKNLITKITEEGVWRIRNFTDRQFFLLQNAIEVILASVILIFSQWWVFIVILAGTIPELIVEMKYGRRVWDIHTGRAENRRKYWELHTHFTSLPSLIELKLFQNTRYFISSARDLFRMFMDEEKRNERKRLTSQMAVLGSSQLVMIFGLVYFTWQVVGGDLKIGTLTFILASIGELRTSLSSLFSNLGRQYQDSLFVSDMFKFLDIKPLVKKAEKGIMLEPVIAPEIVFDNVTFSYPGTNRVVLKNFSLKIIPGEKIALVGINGAGKTTFVKLLLRFYDPDEGKITLNGRDIKEIDLQSWYHQIGAIFQDYARYHFLVKEVIALGRTSSVSSLEKVQKAAKSSEADIFIEEWENKYNQMLGKEFSEGVEPSVGQWQKLALARTFYRDPKVLILDEPTSSIDAEAESKIFDKLESLPDDRTVILISHRFSTVRYAHRIAVIDQGKLIELGTHQDLINLGGEYAKLFNLQAKGYK